MPRHWQGRGRAVGFDAPGASAEGQGSGAGLRALLRTVTCCRPGVKRGTWCLSLVGFTLKPWRGDCVQWKTEGAEQVSNLAQITQPGNGQEAGSFGADGTLAGQDSEGNQEHTEESVAHLFQNTKWIRLSLGLKLMSILSLLAGYSQRAWPDGSGVWALSPLQPRLAPQ